jgi:Methyladenine glycosylase
LRESPATSSESGAFSKNLKHRGFSFVGSTVVYACILLLLSGSDSAQTVVRSSASVPFDFWAEGQKFPAGDYLFDSGFAGSILIRGKGSNLSVAISLVLYADPVKKENANLPFVRRQEKYYLLEVWSVLGKRVVIAEFEHRGEINNEQREVRLVYP